MIVCESALFTVNGGKPEMNKIIYLEGLRGVAALMVVISHFMQVFYPSLFVPDMQLEHNQIESIIREYPTNIFYNGNLAVCIFFVLSGFVLSLSYMKKRDLEVVYANAAKRYLRLGIPVAFSILLAYTLLNLNVYSYGEIKSITRATMEDYYILSYSIMSIIKLALFDVFILGDSGINPVLWTMRYELIGSFLVFILLPIMGLIKEWKVKALAYTIVIIFTFHFLNLYFVAFILGMLLSDLQTNGDLLIKIKSVVSTSIFLVLGLFFGSYPFIDTTNTIYGFLKFPMLDVNGGIASAFYHVLGAFLLMIAILISTRIQNLLSRTTFHFLGKISFSLYLTHFIILCSFSSFLFKYLNSVGTTYNLSVFLTVVISIPLMFLISFYSYKYIDLSAVKLTSKMYNAIFKPIYVSLFRRENRKNGEYILDK